MVGGYIIEIMRSSLHTFRLWCIDGTDECMVVVWHVDGEMLPQLRDQVWWQAGFVYWTANGKDYRLPKIGYFL